MNAFQKTLKAMRDLGPKKLWLYTQYRAGLISGHYRRLTPSIRDHFGGSPSLPPYDSFPLVGQVETDLAVQMGDEIRQGNVRLFGGDPVPLNLNLGASSQHWTSLETTPPEEDIKLTWEPARFGWAITLARAYAYSGDPAFAQAFWDKTNRFLSAHPPNLGRHWQSAQEVAIRIMVWVFCDRVFGECSVSLPEYRQRLWQGIAEHAARIPSTLVYARAQNNNHLLAEAAGLFAAGVYLAAHPQAQAWQRLGWVWFNRGLQGQITEFGTYVQHSSNYHRLMLQLALYVDHLSRESGGEAWPEETGFRLAAATRWLWALTDPETGKVPNLGANDGAYLFPLTSQPWDDFRPVVAAAARAFLKHSLYADERLDEMGGWFNLEAKGSEVLRQPQAGDMLWVTSGEGRGFLRVAQFIDRPSHADQLHVDLWWRGVNVALDPGTFQYNAQPPWDNALTSSKVHNTLVLNGKEQMTPAGRFLWLDWAQGEVLVHEIDQEGQLACVTAGHNGFWKQGAYHQRKLDAVAGGWQVTDSVLPIGKADKTIHAVQLTWLLPDWHWIFDADHTLLVTGPEFGFRLSVAGAEGFNIIRGGERLYGSIEINPTWGWRSERYDKKEPAVMLVVDCQSALPVSLVSRWQFFTL